MSQSTRLPLPMRATTGPGLEAEPVAGAATANTLPSATTMVEVAINSRIIHNIYTQGISSTHSTINNSYPHGSSRSDDIRSSGY